MRQSRRLKIGFMFPMAEGGRGATAYWRDLREMAEFAEDIGFDALWAFDHLLMDWAARRRPVWDPVTPELCSAPAQGVREAWSSLAALAAVTSRIEFGTLVYLHRLSQSCAVGENGGYG